MTKSKVTYGTILSSVIAEHVVRAIAEYCTAEGIDARSLIKFNGFSVRHVDHGRMVSERRSVKVDEQFKNRLIDRFYGYELCDLLDIDSDQIVEFFSDLIEENREMLEEVMLNGR